LKKYMLRFFVLCIGAGLLTFVGCRQVPSSSERKLIAYPDRLSGEPDIQVMVLETTESIDLIVRGSYGLKVTTPEGEKKSGGGTLPVTIRVSATKGTVKLGKDSYKNAMVIPTNSELGVRYSESGGSITKSFPGSIEFSATRSGALRVVVALPLEQYLIGVLPHEMELSSAPEALKAQAVASRTYALYQIKTREGQPYDVYSDVRSQMWRPARDADVRARMAVNSTTGVILTEGYRLFPAYFSADCGGATANARYVFSGSDINALSGRENPFASQSYKWALTIRKSDLERRLAKAGISNGRLLRIELLDEKKQPLRMMGRVYFVRLYLENGVERIVSSNSFRLAVGGAKNELSSTWMYLTHRNDSLIFEGMGRGHGVGLCQTGAKLFAREGQDFTDILKFYYPGAVLLRLW